MSSVALVASSFLPRVGGVEEHVRHLATGLRDRGHTVAVWSVDQGDPPASIRGVKVRYLPSPLPSASVGGVVRFAASAPSAYGAWRHAFATDRPDVVHVQCFGPNGPWSTLVAALGRARLVVGAHGETFMDADRVFDRSHLQRRALTWALGRADAVTACSRYAADDLRRFGYDPSRVNVVGNGVAPPETHVPPPSWLPERFVLGLGRLVRVKGFDLLLRAFAAAQLDDDVSLVIAGDGPERRALERLSRQLGVPGRVVLPGTVPRDEAAAVTRAAEAMVVPSRVEAFGIVVLEGMHAGIPVVVTSRGGAGEIVTDDVDGLVVNPEPAALAAALERLRDPGLRARLGAAGAASASRWTWDAVVDEVEHVYARVLDHEPVARRSLT